MNKTTLKKDIRTLFSKHWVAVLGALLVGFVTIAPNVFFITSLGDSYEGLRIMKTDAEHYYVARVQEIMEGNGFANPYIYEYKYIVPATPGFAAAPIAFAGKLLGMDAAMATMVSVFIIPLLIALLVYAFIYQLTRDRLWSLAGMFLIMFGRILFNVPDILHLLKLEQVYTQFTTYARPMYPQMGTFSFWLLLNSLLIAFRTKSKKWFVYTGILFGIAMYMYFYAATFLIVFMGILTVMLFLVKERKLSAKVAGLSVLGFAVASIAIGQLIKAMHHPLYEEFARGVGLTSTRELIVSSGWVITAIVFVIFLIKAKIPRLHMVVLSSLLLTAFVVVNQQLITGKTLQEGHYHWHYNVPVFSLILIYVGWYITQNKRKLGQTFAALIMLASIFTGIFVQYSSYQRWKGPIAENQRYMPVLRWADEHMEKDDVFFANYNISQIIPVYTRGNVVWDDQATNYFWSQDRKLYTVESILESEDPSQEIQKYRVDYVIWDAKNDPEWAIDRFDFLKEVYDYDNIYMYEILRKN